ncbi:MAG: hypothetical protein RJA51_1123, partial [Actinomycetota bacterium]
MGVPRQRVVGGAPRLSPDKYGWVMGGAARATSARPTTDTFEVARYLRTLRTSDAVRAWRGGEIRRAAEQLAAVGVHDPSLV